METFIGLQMSVFLSKINLLYDGFRATTSFTTFCGECNGARQALNGLTSSIAQSVRRCASALQSVSPTIAEDLNNLVGQFGAKDWQKISYETQRSNNPTEAIAQQFVDKFKPIIQRLSESESL